MGIAEPEDVHVCTPSMTWGNAWFMRADYFLVIAGNRHTDYQQAGRLALTDADASLAQWPTSCPTKDYCWV